MSERAGEAYRYLINGLFATGVNYLILSFNLDVLEFRSAGLANLIASAFGIASSFLGSRHFVFQKHHEPMLSQALKFASLYGAMALMQGFVLLVWTDHLGFDYRVGFLIATALQVLMSYFGNKFLVFKK